MHLAVVGQVADARVVRHQPDASGEAHSAIGTDQAADARSRAVGADGPARRYDLVAPRDGIPQLGPADAAVVGDEADQAGPLSELCACRCGVIRQHRVEAAPVEPPCLPRAAGVGVPDRHGAAAGMQVHASQRNGSIGPAGRNAQSGELLGDPRARVFGTCLRPRMLRGLDQQDRRAVPGKRSSQRGAGRARAGDQHVDGGHDLAAGVAVVTTRGSQPGERQSTARPAWPMRSSSSSRV